MKRRFAVFVAALTAAAALSGVALAASSPSVTTGPASKIKQTRAVLSASVNPNGSSTQYYFQWGLTPGYGLLGHTHSASGTTATTVTATPTGLIPGTVYHYRIVAYNKFGVSVGADRKFKTAGHPPPVVATGPATLLGTTFATLTGVVNPNGATTTFYFQYGVTTAYGSQTFAGSVPAGHAAGTEAVSVQGLAPGTIFHYRLVAIHAGFPASYGADQILMTEPVRPRTPIVHARIRPRRARHRPFVFTTSGRLAALGSIPAQFACSGEVRIIFLHGLHVVAVTVAAVQPTCGFSAETVIAHRPRRGSPRLFVEVRFAGNGYLARAHARGRTVVVG